MKHSCQAASQNPRALYRQAFVDCQQQLFRGMLRECEELIAAGQLEQHAPTVALAGLSPEAARMSAHPMTGTRTSST